MNFRTTLEQCNTNMHRNQIINIVVNLTWTPPLTNYSVHMDMTILFVYIVHNGTIPGSVKIINMLKYF